MYKLVWSGPRAALETAATLLEEAYGASASAVSLTRATAQDAAADVDTGDAATAEWILEAYFTEQPSAKDIHNAVAAFAERIGDAEWAAVAPPAEEETPDIDWVAHSLEGLGVVRAGRFVLYGVHDADRLPDEPDIIPVRIDANQAFGTGHHPTTAGCLALLDRLAGLPPKGVLDLGCGSGVLAIAAAKIWEGRMLAGDIDETSVAIAQENAALNGVADRIDFVTSNGLDHDAIRAAAPFSFVFANILAGPLVSLAPEIAAALAPAGRVMLAGLMTEQEDAVRAAYEAAGLRLLNRLDHAAWPVLLFAKRPA